MDSVLTSIKKLLGIEEDYTHFDNDIIIHINSTLMTLNQIGVGPDKPVYVVSKANTWNDILGNTEDIEAVKTYIYLKVRMLFDPPASSFVLEAMKQQASEIEWRLNVQAESKEV
jgi:hypothetical protein